MTDERRIIVTKLERAPEGFWRARVTVNGGETVDVDRRWGSWQAERRAQARSRTFTRHDLLPDVARALQDRVRPLEKQEKREAAGNA